MRSFAVIDRQPNAEQIAVWIVNREGGSMRAHNTNAVVIDAKNDPEAAAKVRWLTSRRVIVVTDGTTLDGLPIKSDPLTVADIADLLDEVEAHQARILDALAVYKKRTRSKSLVEPTFQARPKREEFAPGTDTASQRALTTANFISKAWGTWLATDEERRRRTVQPKTGKTPWIMPEDMNTSTVPDFPIGFDARLLERAPV